jgi:predicted RNA-binding protein YlxR (DUF448 family)
MNDRTCIVTGEARAPEEMIRFVAGPDGQCRSRPEAQSAGPWLLGHCQARSARQGGGEESFFAAV